jgi:hypothetical protein
MIKIKVAPTKWNHRAFVADYTDGIKQAAGATAKQVPLDLSRRIYMRMDPDGQQQQANAASTIARKARMYGHDIPLLAEGVLSSPAKYRVSPNPFGWSIGPPIGRAMAILGLEAKGYRFWGISKQVQNFLGAALMRVNSFMTGRIESGHYGG